MAKKRNPAPRNNTRKKTLRRQSKAKKNKDSEPLIAIAIGKWLKRLIFIALVPVAYIATTSFAQLVSISRENENIFANTNSTIFIFGFIAWLIYFFTLPKPLALYTLGHELTHFLFVKIFGGKVFKIKISQKGGYVTANKTNDIIRLAPYLVPFYTVILFITYLVVTYYLTPNYENLDKLKKIFIFLAGVSIAFHLSFTAWLWIIHWHDGNTQTDFSESGTLFSLILIYLVNLFIVVICFIIISEKTQIFDFFQLLDIKFSDLIYLITLS